VTGYQQNPVPPSKLEKASQVYERFTGHEAGRAGKVKIEPIDVGAQIGYVEGIAYDTVRDGVPEKYFHKFKKRSRPMLIASHDGQQIQLVGGDYEFTECGIVDN